MSEGVYAGYMTILITSGGTIVKIDDVRHIANFSKGEFPSQIARECLLIGHKVIYLHARGARKPFCRELTFDPAKPAGPQFKGLLKTQKIFRKLQKNIRYVEFVEFSDYAKSL
mgnify:FL=1